MKVNLFKSSSSAGRSNKPPARPSIRGKISGPIPIPSPADDEFPIRKPGSAYVAPKAPPSDEEFPIRRPGAARASTIPIEVPEPEPSDVPEHEQEAAEAVAAQELQPNASAVSGTRTDVEQANNASGPPPSNAPPAPPPGASPASGGGGGGSSAPRTSPTQHRTNPSSTLRYSQVSAASTGNTGGSGSGRPQRKKSTLRNALSRLFGRRKKTASQGSNETESAGMSQQHRSVSFESPRITAAGTRANLGAVPLIGPDRPEPIQRQRTETIGLSTADGVRARPTVALGGARRHNGHRERTEFAAH